MILLSFILARVYSRNTNNLLKGRMTSHTAGGVSPCFAAKDLGWLGKGHLFREVDALDGVMGRVAEAASIQFRVLNRRKGPALRASRPAASYAAAMQAAIRETANLSSNGRHAASS